MKRVPIDEDLVGETIGVELRVESDKPNTLYKLRLPEGKELTLKDVRRLRRSNIEYICIDDNSDEDLSPHLTGEDLNEIHHKTVETLERLVDNLMPEEGQEPKQKHRNYEQLKKQLTKLIDLIEETDYLYAYSLLRNHDDHTSEHSFDVCKLALEFGVNRRDFFQQKLMEENGDQELVLNDSVLELGLGALLHDVGKWTIKQTVLTKSDSLNEQEWKQIEKHPIRGYELLKNLGEPVSEPILSSALDHHENFGGNGYPLKKVGKGIHLFGRIIKIFDVYSALTANRPYSVKVSPNRAKQEMKHMQSKDIKQFDPEIFSEFLELIPPFPIGQNVILSDGSMGVVVDYDDDQWDQPTVNILKPGSENHTQNETIRANVPQGPSIVS